MTMPADLTAAHEPVVKSLEELNIPYYVSGSVANSVFGAIRATNDIDLVVLFPINAAQEFYDKLLDQYYVDLTAIRDAIRLLRSFNLVHLATAIKLDLFISPGGSGEKTVFSRIQALKIDPSTNFVANFASPEDLIIAKLNWYDKGGRASEQQIQDIKGILKVQESLDQAYLKQRAASLGLHDLLLNILS